MRVVQYNPISLRKHVCRDHGAIRVQLERHGHASYANATVVVFPDLVTDAPNGQVLLVTIRDLHV